jgi:hypothetical protein
LRILRPNASAIPFPESLQVFGPPEPVAAAPAASTH